jgi:hypothetical protein
VGTTLDRSRRAAGLRTVTVDEQIDRAAGGPVPGRHQIPPPPRPVLDPFGLGLPFDVIVDIFAGRPAGQYVPATEVLFRFDANAIRRIRGVVHGDPNHRGREKMLEALDRAAGGSWWRDEDDPT